MTKVDIYPRNIGFVVYCDDEFYDEYLSWTGVFYILSALDKRYTLKVFFHPYTRIYNP